MGTRSRLALTTAAAVAVVAGAVLVWPGDAWFDDGTSVLAPPVATPRAAPSVAPPSPVPSPSPSLSASPSPEPTASPSRVATAAPTATATPSRARPTASARPSRPASPRPSGTASSGTLSTGARGPAVRALERRLSGLGYWLGAPDDVFDSRTSHAVVAFQKLHGLSRDGVVGPRTAAVLADAGRPRARSGSGSLVEVDLTHQVLLVVRGGSVTAVLDASTGKVPGSTPVGRFRVERAIDGYRTSPLGVLYRPRYVYGGIAVHGYPSVPPYPASHGCIRTTNAAMDRIWAAGLMPIGSPVWIYR